MAVTAKDRQGVAIGRSLKISKAGSGGEFAQDFVKRFQGVQKGIGGRLSCGRYRQLHIWGNPNQVIIEWGGSLTEPVYACRLARRQGGGEIEASECVHKGFDRGIGFGGVNPVPKRGCKGKILAVGYQSRQKPGDIKSFAALFEFILKSGPRTPAAPILIPVEGKNNHQERGAGASKAKSKAKHPAPAWPPPVPS